MQERYSLKYKLTRAVSSLNPNLIYAQLTTTTTKKLLTILQEAKLILREKLKFKKLFNVVKLVCILSHGNATVERQVYDRIHH